MKGIATVEKINGEFRLVGKNRSNIGYGRFPDSVQAQNKADELNGVKKDVPEPEVKKEAKSGTGGSKPKEAVGKSEAKGKDSKAKPAASKSS